MERYNRERWFLQSPAFGAAREVNGIMRHSSFSMLLNMRKRFHIISILSTENYICPFNG
jgi:hypothetical protein